MWLRWWWIGFLRITPCASCMMNARLCIKKLRFNLNTFPKRNTNTKLRRVVETIYQFEMWFDCKDKDGIEIRLYEAKTKKIWTTHGDEIFMDAPRCDNRFKWFVQAVPVCVARHSTAFWCDGTHQTSNATVSWLVTFAILHFQLNSVWLNQRNIHPLTARRQNGGTQNTKEQFKRHSNESAVVDWRIDKQN